ncbi:hypothetical protein HH682_15365 [Rosenbergiella sp. S61]|uniref:Uncharacterized protein n=1 Tax=Rosenbergiella gaditana TaxID=2726987 RepID=A0ABS5T079_9GAMM|nr:hypothetical protein [Rosenbergiella gaditana]MBT0725754.1 hypothetical protein [Rosenbergiella gaditana]
MKNSTKSLFNFLYLCFSMSVVIFILTMFGRLLGAWLAWNTNDNFPFSLADLFICLKLTWFGPPAGFIFWYFYYR